MADSTVDSWLVESNQSPAFDDALDKWNDYIDTIRSGSREDKLIGAVYGFAIGDIAGAALAAKLPTDQPWNIPMTSLVEWIIADASGGKTIPCAEYVFTAGPVFAASFASLVAIFALPIKSIWSDNTPNDSSSDSTGPIPMIMQTLIAERKHNTPLPAVFRGVKLSSLSSLRLSENLSASGLALTIFYVSRAIDYAHSHKAQPCFVKTIEKIAAQGGLVRENCAVAGALLGAYIGYSAMPEEWIMQLVDKNISFINDSLMARLSPAKNAQQ